MTLYAYNSDVPFAVPLVLGLGDDVIVGMNGFVYGQDALFKGQLVHQVTIAGGIAAGFLAIEFGTVQNQAVQCAIVITQTGMLQGGNALVYYGRDLSLVNAGTIVSGGTALYLSGLAGNGSRIDNAGTIASAGSGTIQGDFDMTEAYTIHNSGRITNTVGGYSVLLWNLALADDRVFNSGLMVGSVHMGGGNDLYDGRGGGTVVGTVFGGDGNDRFRPGVTEEVFAGDTGADTLEFRGGGAVQIALNNAWDAGGRAEGDTWVSIENVIGSGQADLIGGDGAANVLSGMAGADQLYGQDGTDTLVGGGGKDTLSGGRGNDTFQFHRLGDIGDIVLDFSSALAGNNDRFLISTSGFGGGLVAGALVAGQFRARADNAAQDADDRFIFRTTDQTLWYDQDGTGAELAVMVADLQVGASMTFADIVIF